MIRESSLTRYRSFALQEQSVSDNRRAIDIGTALSWYVSLECSLFMCFAGPLGINPLTSIL